MTSVSAVMATPAFARDLDRNAPQSTIRRAPQRKVETVQRLSLAKFRFHANQGNARFQCRLDAGEKDLLGRIIRYSDNGTATSVRNIVGARAIMRAIQLEAKQCREV